MNLLSNSIRFFLHILVFEVALLVNLVFFLDIFGVLVNCSLEIILNLIHDPVLVVLEKFRVHRLDRPTQLSLTLPKFSLVPARVTFVLWLLLQYMKQIVLLNDVILKRRRQVTHTQSLIELHLLLTLSYFFDEACYL